MSETILKTENLSKSYTLGKRNVKALDNVNLEVKKGEFVSIMGPSGSGKTTLLNVLGCLDKPTEGKVLLDQVDLGKQPEKELYKIRRSKIGFVFQTFNLLPYLNASRERRIATRVYGKIQERKKPKSQRIAANGKPLG